VSLGNVLQSITWLVISFDLDQLDDDDPFEVDHQAAHLFKHHKYGLEDVYDLWDSRPLFDPAVPPTHWLMVAEIAGEVLVVPLAPPRSGSPTRCRPIGRCLASKHLADQFRRDR
jgi:hypothetical protein